MATIQHALPGLDSHSHAFPPTDTLHAAALMPTFHPSEARGACAGFSAVSKRSAPILPVSPEHHELSLSSRPMLEEKRAKICRLTDTCVCRRFHAGWCGLDTGVERPLPLVKDEHVQTTVKQEILPPSSALNRSLQVRYWTEDGVGEGAHGPHPLPSPPTTTTPFFGFSATSSCFHDSNRFISVQSGWFLQESETCQYWTEY